MVYGTWSDQMIKGAPYGLGKTIHTQGCTVAQWLALLPHS